jgi:hypothetical protein
MTYKVWENETSTLLGEFKDEETARSAVRLNIETYGREFVATWSVVEVTLPGKGREIAYGQALADWALRVPA